MDFSSTMIEFRVCHIYIYQCTDACKVEKSHDKVKRLETELENALRQLNFRHPCRSFLNGQRSLIYGGYYMVARRYDIYLRALKKNFQHGYCLL